MTNLSPSLKDSNRTELKDKTIPDSVHDASLANVQLIRFVAINKKFTNVKFSNTTLDSCYLRDCQFDSCDFTGARFIATNLHGSKFIGCKFEYATFERTFIDEHVLSENCPSHENLKMRFARSLRVNYQQIGDAAAANHAIKVELEAMEVHLRKSWKSNDQYYRKKYKGIDRINQFLAWLNYKIQDAIWGNGESIISLVRSVIVINILISINHLYNKMPLFTFASITESLFLAPQIFFGITRPEYISSNFVTLITVLRLIAFGLFMSILVKRLSRR